MQHEPAMRALAQFVHGRGDAPELGLHLPIYARLIHERTVSAVEATLPRTAERLGRARLSAWCARFLKERGARSPYFRHVSGEFVRWGLDAGLFGEGLPSFAADAARFELACFEVNVSECDPLAPTAELSLGLPVRFSAASELLTCKHAVHEDVESPAARRVHLLIHRAPDTRRVLRLELTEAAAQILQRLRAGAALEDGIKGGLVAAALPCTDRILVEIAQLLAQLAQSGVVLGARVAG